MQLTILSESRERPSFAGSKRGGVRIFDSADSPADPRLVMELQAGVGTADLAAPPVVLPDFHHKSNMELPSSVAVATVDSIRPTLTSASVNCGMALLGFDAERPGRAGVAEFYRRVQGALPLPGPARRSELTRPTCWLRGAGRGSRPSGSGPARAWSGSRSGPVSTWSGTGARPAPSGAALPGRPAGPPPFRDRGADQPLRRAAAGRGGVPRAEGAPARGSAGAGDAAVPRRRGRPHRRDRGACSAVGGKPPADPGGDGRPEAAVPPGHRAVAAQFRERLALYFRAGCPPVSRATDEGQRLLLANAAAMNYGFAFRTATYAGPAAHRPRRLRCRRGRLVVDSPHNSIYEEEVDGASAVVHRHNSCRAFPAHLMPPGTTFARTGQAVLLPGTNRTSSYLCVAGPVAGAASTARATVPGR